ncbi:MAG: glycosyltransferase family 2 protein [Fretibacterium sp.]|nr:glycosyltransferase family 2 protein [Fretibacterium sp.]
MGAEPLNEGGRKVSFVIPCYRSEQTLGAVVDEIIDAMSARRETFKETLEIILIDDCSPDGTLSVIRELVRRHPFIRGVGLARNFGQHAAIMAGLAMAEGDVIVCLDDDGQSPADEVSKLLDKLDEGYDIVFADYPEKKESPFRLWGSRVNDRMTVSLLNKPKDIALNSFVAFNRMVADELLRYKGAFPYLAGLMLRTTRNVANVTVRHRERMSGKSGYTFGKLLGLWLNGFTAFSIKPLRWAAFIGTAFAFAGFALQFYYMARKLLLPQIPEGWTSIIALMMFFNGVILIVLGLIGEYVGRIYLSVSATPQYVIREVIT